MITTLLILMCMAVLVAWSSSKAVRYSLELASILHLKTFVVGFIVLSLSTSLPELSVAVMSGLSGVPRLSIGNIVGANFIDLSLILGLVVILVGEIKLEKKDELDLITIFAIATLVMLLIFTGENLTRAQGVVLIGLYVLSIFHIYSQEKLEVIVDEERKEAKAELSDEVFMFGRIGTLIKLFFTLLILIASSRLLVDSAVKVATDWGVPTNVIGATLVALGTTLPELTLELNAIRRKEYALALGDAFGSALTNSTLVLGVLALLSPVHVELPVLTYMLLLLIAALVVIWNSLLNHKKIDKKSGIILVSIYMIFLTIEVLQVTVFK
ncbi:MAG: sodium:calcium antiporter [Candidatus Altiarchaeota archaeon]